jgi:putative transposase
MTPTFRFYDPGLVSKVTCNRLTHWEQVGATYFITFRLADAVPSGPLADSVREKREWLAAHPEPRSAEMEKEYHRRFSHRFERWLDAGMDPVF